MHFLIFVNHKKVRKIRKEIYVWDDRMTNKLWLTVYDSTKSYCKQFKVPIFSDNENTAKHKSSTREVEVYHCQESYIMAVYRFYSTYILLYNDLSSLHTSVTITWI